MQSALGWKGYIAMSVYRDGKRWRYRTKFSVKIGDQIRTFRVSGTTPRNENNKQKAIDMERAHVLRVQSEAEATGEGTTHEPTDSITAPPVEAPAPVVPTVKEFAPVYLGLCRIDDKLSSFQAKEDIVKRYIVSRLGDLRLDAVDKAVIQDFRKALSETRNARLKRAVQMLNPKTINNVLTVLGHLLHVAQERGLIVAVPKIKRVKAPPPKFDFLTFDEADRLIAHAEGEWRTMILVALRTGLRRGELLGLRWEDVDLVNGRLYVCENYVRGLFGVPKSGKPREVALSDEARRALAGHRHTRGERVFCDAQGRPFTQGVMASQLDRMCRLAKLRPVGWHVMRHSFASHLVMRGAAIRTVQELMGHASIVITQRYAHLMPDVARDAVKLLDASVKTLHAVRGDLPSGAVVPTECQNEPLDRVAA
jgi:integrase